MKSKKNILLMLTLLICSGPAIAGESATSNNNSSEGIKTRSPAGITSTFLTCIDKANSDNIAIATCLSQEKRYQDARLNETYKRLLGSLDGKARDALVAAERVWVTLQSKDEDFESLLYGNEQIDNLQQGENEVFRTCERASVLDKYLNVVTNK